MQIMESYILAFCNNFAEPMLKSMTEKEVMFFIPVTCNTPTLLLTYTVYL